MPWETTWLLAAGDTQLPPCPGNQQGRPAASGPQLSPCPATYMASGSHGIKDTRMPWKPTWPTESPGPTVPAVHRDPTRPAAATGSRILVCPGNQHGQRQTQAHSFSHAPVNNMAAREPQHTASAMPREPTWPAAEPGSQLPPCPWKQLYRQQPRDQGFWHALETNIADGQPLAHSSRHAPRTNMADRQPQPTAPAMPWEPTWPPGSPGLSADEMSWEPTWPAAALGPHLLPCP